MGLFSSLFQSYSQKEVRRIEPITAKVLALEPHYQTFSDRQLRAETDRFRALLASGQGLDDILPEAFAVCREAAWRVLSMKHFPVQVTGGVILHQGRIAEMKTGEGKTLVATLPAYLNALGGNGVHIVTVNDYLATRDSEWMGKLYRFLGLEVGLIVSGMEAAERKTAYAADITYGTNNELGFDYLRDNMVIYRENRVQRGHAYAIVDEVDSILIDEARTPLIISGQGDRSTDLYEQADRMARTLEMVKVAELNDKEDNDKLGGDYLVDEKARTATLTPEGVKKVERAFNVDNLMDPENITLLHHINQAVRAHGTMQRDVDYIVKDGQVIIVDAFTGRLMIGRRFNEGLHQAIEAKEGVKVERESKTLATITFQNYFRMYGKLSGMTGTALTEENEFRDIYNLDVIEVPTNRPMIRADHPDLVYKTEKAKFEAVIEAIEACHRKGQPVLVGTVSIEKSELISRLLKRRGIKHEVLNAKQHEREAAIVAQAGKKGAITIATNMAGRGTDIVLGGNADYMARSEMARKGFEPDMIAQATAYFETDDEEILAARKFYNELYELYKKQVEPEAAEVIAAGGLFIMGTERHESRRIDNQLRGRSGRQGDPGESRFFLSLEDDLMRLFGGERVQSLMNFMKLEDDVPIEAKALSGTIENAQRKIEGRNFQTRKSVLQFDDVMNKQREVIYGQRGQVLDGADLRGAVLQMVDESIADAVGSYTAGEDKDAWNLQGLCDHYQGLLTRPGEFRYTPAELDRIEREDLAREIQARAHKLYGEREERFGAAVMRELERVVLLRNVDEKWMDHIDAMDELRRGIYLRSYGQNDPVVEYRIEGFEMFDQMIAAIREDTTRMMLTVQIRREGEQPQREQVARPTAASAGGDGSVKKQPAKTAGKIGRNDPCPCGSGKKYKKCHGASEGAQ